jgi:hypothetical protein
MKLYLDMSQPTFDIRRSSRFRPRILQVCAFLLIATSTVAMAGEVTLVPSESFWRYHDTGSNWGDVWRGSDFDDSKWDLGETHFGYGETDEATVVRCRVAQPAGTACAAEPDNRIITSYYRRTFEVISPSPRITGLTLSIVVDDGAAVYLNGTEVVRQNLAGTLGQETVHYLTPAEVSISGDDEDTFTDYAIDASHLVNGTNVVAVEIHQKSANSNDISFDFRLTATDPSLPTLVRGPYLQVGSSTGGLVRWRTHIAAPSVVRYGIAPGVLNQTVSDMTPKTEHEISLTGLTPARRYYYAVGISSNAIDDITSGDDRSFLTAPPLGDPGPWRIWVLGDSGQYLSGAEKPVRVRDVYRRDVRADRLHTDVLLMLGDNAYPDGTDVEHQIALFDRYPMFLENYWLWPTVGNHEMKTHDGSPGFIIPYFDIFTLPTMAEAGGLPSGTEDYYSFDYGNIHFICLDSATWELTPNSPPAAMLTWATADVAATDQQWIIVFWHHPPYSKGTHDADTGSLSTSMREDFLPFLEAAGVDLILAGHSHVYERSKFINGLYGASETYDESTMAVNAGNGDPAGNGAYVKVIPTDSPRGTVYAVVGSSSLTGGGPLDHPAMVILDGASGHGLEELGSLVLDVEDNRLDARFLDDLDNVLDRFTILKKPPEIFADGFESGLIFWSSAVGNRSPGQ